jgi:hypothetical protein
MGLDMYAYVGRAGQREEYWDQYGEDISEDKKVSKPQELAYWRKHPNLHGWMERLWLRKNGYALSEDQQFIEGKQAPDFNGVELELTFDDILALERDINNGKMAKLGTTGFFFGNPSDDHYKEYDLKFCIDAKAELFLGRKVFYNSSW